MGWRMTLCPPRELMDAQVRIDWRGLGQIIETPSQPPFCYPPISACPLFVLPPEGA